MTLHAKIEQAKDRIRQASMDYTCYIGHSGGKDSAVVLHLAESIDHNFPIVHTPKTQGMNAIHPATLTYLYSLSVSRQINLIPIEQMLKWLAFNDLEVQIDGTRSDENERSDRSSDLIVDGKSINRAHMTQWNPSGLFGTPMLYPIFDWSTEEVWTYIAEFKVPISKEYEIIKDPFYEKFCSC